jgi:hypothetical protein
VRHGYEAGDSVVTTLPAEPPHNVNDHGSTSGEGILTTIAGTVSQPGANTIYGKAPLFIVFGPEHAQTVHRDGFSVADVQEKIYELSKVHVSRVSKENQQSYAGMERKLAGEYYYMTPSPEDIHVAVAGGPGKHSAYIASFGFNKACSVRVPRG